MVFDLDPSDEDFGKVQRTAKRLKQALDDLDLVTRSRSSSERQSEAKLSFSIRCETPTGRPSAARLQHTFCKNVKRM